MAAQVELRPFVRAVAAAMEKQLRANGHKGGLWHGLDEVLAKLLEEVAELAAAASLSQSPEDILREAADVANVAGMVVSYCCDVIPSVTIGAAEPDDNICSRCGEELPSGLCDTAVHHCSLRPK